jgi:hypothetical protein
MSSHLFLLLVIYTHPRYLVILCYLFSFVELEFSLSKLFPRYLDHVMVGVLLLFSKFSHRL